MTEKRSPVASGRFYPSEKNSLKKKIENCFEHERGPGKPVGKEKSSFLAGVVPHAGYDFSGPCAAHVYQKIGSKREFENAVVLGTLHSAAGGIFLDDRDYVTPLGDIENVFKNTEKDVFPVERDYFNREHSIEVQLPFLQYLRDDFSFLPVGVSSTDFGDLKKGAEKLAKSLDMDKTIFIASSDLTHCGMRYGQAPPKNMSAGEFAREQDEKAIKRVLAREPEKLLETVKKHDITMCGAHAVAMMLQIIGDREVTGELLCHYTSSDITGGGDAVGYAGISFQET